MSHSDRLKIDRFTGPATFVAGGREFIDLSSGGIFAAVLGPDAPELRTALMVPEYLHAYGSHFGNSYAERLKSELCDLTGYEACVLFSTGSEAAEAWWRACRTHTGKPCAWGGLVDPDMVGSETGAAPDAMHGWTLGALIMAGKMAWPQWGLGWANLLGGERFGQTPEMTACAIWEPYHAPSAQFHRVDPTINRLKDLQKTFPDIPHCCDEIQGGLWRTGKLLAHQWYDDLRPDAVLLGKALGGGIPISALLGPKWIEDLIDSACLHSTHSDNPVCASAALAVLESIRRHKLDEAVVRLGAVLDDCVKEWPVRVHNRGLLAGIELADEAQADKVVAKCRERGVWVIRTGRKWVKLGPAYTIPEADLIEGLKRVEAAILGALYAD